MRWRRLFFGRLELTAHFFLTLEQRGHLQLQALDGPLLVKVAISSVDEAGAIANLESEGEGFDFDAQRAATRAA